MGYGSEPKLELTISLEQKDVINAFHGIYFGRVDYIRWLGVPVLKCPIDLWAYQEIICHTRPDIIIETGTYFGGSALFLATVCQLIGHGRIITIDITQRDSCPQHPRIDYIIGDSVSDKMFQSIQDKIMPQEQVMVILDSDHHEGHVSRELDRYAPLVSEGCYLIVEDTNLNGHPVGNEFGSGPWEAVEKFLPQHPEFQKDTIIESRHILTFNPGGYLRRVS